jgi:hypothetical protein
MDSRNPACQRVHSVLLFITRHFVQHYNSSITSSFKTTCQFRAQLQSSPHSPWTFACSSTILFLESPLSTDLLSNLHYQFYQSEIFGLELCPSWLVSFVTLPEKRAQLIQPPRRVWLHRSPKVESQARYLPITTSRHTIYSRPYFENRVTREGSAKASVRLYSHAPWRLWWS